MVVGEFLEKSFKFNINNKEFSVEKTTKDLLVNYKTGQQKLLFTLPKQIKLLYC